MNKPLDSLHSVTPLEISRLQRFGHFSGSGDVVACMNFEMAIAEFFRSLTDFAARIFDPHRINQKSFSNCYPTLFSEKFVEKSR